MWLLPSFQHSLITFSFSTQSLICTWLTKQKNNNRLSLQAYEKYLFDSYEILNGMLYNPTCIARLITQFLKKNNQHDAFVAFTLSNECLLEDFITMPTSSPKRSDFNHQENTSRLWGYRHLYQNDDGQSVFYTYTFSRAALLQYKLLAIHTNINLLSITPQTIALIGAYKTIFGTTFRASQFALDMMRHNNSVENCISNDILHRIITTAHTSIPPHDMINLAPACGMITLEGSFL